MTRWLAHLWNDPISAKEQFEAGLLLMVVLVPFLLIKIAFDAHKRDL